MFLLLAEGREWPCPLQLGRQLIVGCKLRWTAAHHLITTIVLSCPPIRSRSHLADHAITITARSAISKNTDHSTRLHEFADHASDHNPRSHRSLRSANHRFFAFLHFACAISPITNHLLVNLQQIEKAHFHNTAIYLRLS